MVRKPGRRLSERVSHKVQLLPLRLGSGTSVIEADFRCDCAIASECAQADHHRHRKLL